MSDLGVPAERRHSVGQFERQRVEVTQVTARTVKRYVRGTKGCGHRVEPHALSVSHGAMASVATAHVLSGHSRARGDPRRTPARACGGRVAGASTLLPRRRVMEVFSDPAVAP